MQILLQTKSILQTKHAVLYIFRYTVSVPVWIKIKKEVSWVPHTNESKLYVFFLKFPTSESVVLPSVHYTLEVNLDHPDSSQYFNTKLSSLLEKSVQMINANKIKKKIRVIYNKFVFDNLVHI